MKFPCENNIADQSETSTIESEVKNQKKYNRISSTTRDQLLTKIFFQNKKIKIAAKELNMNYSTAKTILHLYRKKLKKGQKIKEEKRCLFSPLISQKNCNPVQICVTQGGKEVPSFEAFKRMGVYGEMNIDPHYLKALEEQEKINFEERVIKLKIFEEMIRNQIQLQNTLQEKMKEKCLRKVIVIKPIASNC